MLFMEKKELLDLSNLKIKNEDTGVEQNLNVLGFIQYDGEHYIVITNMPGFKVKEDEYLILGLEENKDGTTQLKWIESDEFYYQLCGMWESWLEEIEK